MLVPTFNQTDDTENQIKLIFTLCLYGPHVKAGFSPPSNIVWPHYAPCGTDFHSVQFQDNKIDKNVLPCKWSFKYILQSVENLK